MSAKPKWLEVDIRWRRDPRTLIGVACIAVALVGYIALYVYLWLVWPDLSVEPWPLPYERRPWHIPGKWL